MMALALRVLVIVLLFVALADPTVAQLFGGGGWGNQNSNNNGGGGGWGNQNSNNNNGGGGWGNNNQGPSLTIPFGKPGQGGFSIGPNGFGIQAPGTYDRRSETYRPGVGLNIPFPPAQPSQPNRPNYDDDYDYEYVRPSRPTYRPSQPSYQQYTPAPANIVESKPAVAAPKNKVATKKKPASNVMKFTGLAQRASAETDARQQVEAEQSKNMLDVDITEQIKNTGDAGLLAEWQEIVKKGSPTAEVDAFLNKHGPGGTNTLGPDLQTNIDLRQEFAEYADALESGALSPAGKDQALNNLQTAVAAAGAKPGVDPTFFKTLGGNVDQMQKFNTMGQLADAVENDTNPFPTLVTGAGNMGMPVMFVSEMTGYPVMSMDPAPDAKGAAATLVIINPSTNGETVSYLLDTHKFDMVAGAQQKLDKLYTISFDSGVSGEKKYKLSKGVYEWRSDAKTGWNLYKVKVNVVLDNSRYDGEFKYLLNNEAKTIGAGEVVEHSSDQPIELAFDSGKGGEIRKMLTNGRYIVGLDPDRGALDLFDAAKVETAEAQQPDYLPSTLAAGNNATKAQRVEALLSQLQPAAGGSTAAAAKPRVISPVGAAKASAQSVESLLNSLKQTDAAGGG